MCSGGDVIKKNSLNYLELSKILLIKIDKMLTSVFKINDQVWFSCVKWKYQYKTIVKNQRRLEVMVINLSKALCKQNDIGSSNRN